MNKIHRKVEYALMALKHMRAKAPGALTPVKEICALYGCPFDATSRVLQQLAQRGILKSEQGAYGGYQVIRDLNRVSFFELLETILGRLGVAKCLYEEEAAGCEMIGTCNIVTPVHVLNRRLNEFYKSLSVSDLLYPRSAGQALGNGRADVSGFGARAFSTAVKSGVQLSAAPTSLGLDSNVGSKVGFEVAMDLGAEGVSNV